MHEIIEIATKAAGLAGISVIVFYYLFREFIRKTIFPKLTKKQSYKLLRLFLILVFVTTIAGIVGWNVQQYLQDRSNVVVDTGQLTLNVHRSEYVHFMVFHPSENLALSTFPDNSFVRNTSGLSVSQWAVIKQGDLVKSIRNVSFSDIGLGADDLEGGFPPHLPEGEMIIDFTLFNEGSLVVVDGIYAELLETLDIPDKAILTTLLPVLSPIEDSVVFTREKKIYRLFGDNIFAYKKGDVDLFRVNAFVADSETPGIFKFRFRIDYRLKGEKKALLTNAFFLVKFLEGRTNRIPYEKRGGRGHAVVADQDPRQMASEKKMTKDFAVVNGHLETPAERLVTGMEKCRDESYSADSDYIKHIYLKAIMGGERDALQQKGVLYENEAEDLKAKDQASRKGYVQARSNQKGKYMIVAYPGFSTYAGSTANSYYCLVSAVINLAKENNLLKQSKMCQFFIDTVSNGAIDSGGFIDTIPLLAVLRNEVCYDFLVSKLGATDNPVIEHQICTNFGYVKYEKSSAALLKVLKKDNYARDPALHALGINGNVESAKALISLYHAGGFRETETQALADTLVASALALSIDYVKENANSEEASRKNLSYCLLSSIKKSRKPSQQEILQGLNHRDSHIRWESLQLLGLALRKDELDISTVQVREIVTAKLDDKDWRVRSEAIDMVVKLGDTHFLNKLEQMLKVLNDSFREKTDEANWRQYEWQHSLAINLMWAFARLKYREAIDLILSVHSNPKFEYGLFTDGPLKEFDDPLVPEKVRIALTQNRDWALSTSDRDKHERYMALCRVAVWYEDEESLPIMIGLFRENTAPEVLADVLFWSYDQLSRQAGAPNPFWLGLKEVTKEALERPEAWVRLRAVQFFSILSGNAEERQWLIELAKEDPDTEIRNFVGRIDAVD
jgi:hypothetical protein